MSAFDAIDRACSVDGCTRPVKARGWCNAHHKRWMRHGDHLGGRTPEGVPMQWLEDVALSFDGADCLTWPFADAGNGYGRIWTGERSAYAHRVVCERTSGPAPDGCDAAHSCGNGDLGCVNPHHLSWKTRQGNFADKLAHGTHQRGERHGQSKLSEAAARDIKSNTARLAVGDLARRYGVSSRTVSDIQGGRRWGWLSP